LFRQDRDIGELVHRVAQLGHHDAFPTHFDDEVELLAKRLESQVGHVVGREVEAHPGFGDPQAAQLELPLQSRDVGRKRVTDAAPLEPGEGDLAHALRERDVVAHPREVIVGPAGRHDPEGDLVALEHGHRGALPAGST
jgi:hypothetical protein